MASAPSGRCALAESQRASVAAVFLMLAALLGAWWVPLLWPVAAVLAVTLVVVNLDLYRYLARCRGVLFAVPFVTSGVKRVDPDAEHGSWGFRVLIFPGAVALWPLMWRRLRAGPAALPVERSPHRDAAEGRA